MKVIAEHDFIQNDLGELALLITEISEAEPAEPILLVSPDAELAYFHRGPDDIHVIDGINNQVIDTLRKVDTVLIIEMLGEDISHAYDTPTGLMDVADEDPKVPA